MPLTIRYRGPYGVRATYTIRQYIKILTKQMSYAQKVDSYFVADQVIAR